MNELAGLFKQISNLVVEQGTILDRIDYNISDSRVNIQKGNKELKKTAKAETSSRARGAMICLTQWILVCLIVLVFKHTWVALHRLLFLL